MNIQTTAAFSIYFAVLLFIGYLAYRKQRNATDFVLGGRSMSFWLTAISAHASDMSVWLFMGFPAMVYNRGLLECWSAIGLLIGMFLCWQLVAPQLRQSTENYNSLTLSSYLSNRFNDAHGIIRILTSVMLVVFLTFYIGAGLIGLGVVSELCFDINYYTAITISTLIVVVYTAIGGYMAIAWIDLFRGLFLLSMIVLVPSVAFYHLPGGLSDIISLANLKNIPLTLFPDYTLASLLSALTIAASWGLGYFGQPHILNKFMGIKNVKEMRKAQYLGMSWQVLTLGAAIMVGLIGIAFFSNGLANDQHIFILMAKQLFSPFFAALILCAVISAALSNIDSQILVFASIFSEDIYKGLLRKKALAKEMLWASRIAVALVSLFAYVIAYQDIRSIYELVKYSWSGLGSSFGPLVLAALYSKKANIYGAVAGIVVGGTVAATWGYFDLPFKDSALIPGFVLSFASIFVVSWVTNHRKK